MRFGLLALIIAAQQIPSATTATGVPVDREPYHKPVFTNDRVQVLDVVIPAGSTSLFHTHVLDLAGVTIIPGPTRTEILGQPPTDDPPDRVGETWFESFPRALTHRVGNAGTAPIHIVAIQLRLPPHAPVAGSDPWRAPAGGTVELVNARVRIAGLTVLPGQATPTHAHTHGYVLVALGPGDLLEVGGSGGAAHHVTSGFLGWHAPHPDHVIRNVGGTSVDLIEFEFAE